MKIAIYNRSGSFSKTWINYCINNTIDYKLVDIYKSSIILDLLDCNALLWHHSHTNYKDILFAKQLLFAIEQSGIKVFPDFYTGWHFDDKIGQKYLLESINAPVIPTYIFYSKDYALKWVEDAKFPLVFKLRNGAGGSNVSLVESKKVAIALVKKAFAQGFSKYNRRENLRNRVKKFINGQGSVIEIIKGLIRLFFPTELERMSCNEKGYIYFQDFIPGNDSDIRVIVIGDRAYGMIRKNRKGDFRASGSKSFIYTQIDEQILEIAFEVSLKLKLQAVAYDFIWHNMKPVIIEISSFFGTEGSGKCNGYYTRDKKFHKKEFNGLEWIIENIIQINNR